MKFFIKYGIFLFASVLVINSNHVQADEIPSNSPEAVSSETLEKPINEVVIGNPDKPVATLKDDENTSNSDPSITKVEVSGDPNPSATGVDFFKDIEINLEGKNLTDDNFLTKEGLHWSDKTYTEIIQGTENGILNDTDKFGKSNTPSTPVVAHSTNVGDSGRINFVGKTRSGIDLDLLWTVKASDKDEWASNSGYNDSSVKGLGFAGEQFVPEATGNSIVALYNNASNLALNYQIVKHGTKLEQPIIVSFISTDIDAAQGVQTNLANLVEIIPAESNLVKKDGIIYDTNPGVVGLNGSKDLPKGGYLGAGFISNFDYTFYSPAPERVNDSYYYPIAVRYDIFGSSLQANINSRISRPIVVQYIDKQGKELKKTEYYKGFDDESYKIESLNIPEFRLVDVKKLAESKGRTTIQFVYQKEFSVTLKFQDKYGKKLDNNQFYKVLEGQKLRHTPKTIEGYVTPKTFETLVKQTIEKVFVYTKVPKPKKIVQPPTPKKIMKRSKEQKSQSQISPSYVPSIPKTNSNQFVSALVVGNSVPVAPFSYQGSNQAVQPNNRPSVQDTQVEANNNQNIQDTQIEPKKQEQVSKKANRKDPFLINTKMNQAEKNLFLNYIKAVGDEARKKYGKDKDKVNHAIANAIARVPYADDRLQSLTNDFGQAPEKLTQNISNLLDRLHTKPEYSIDFPHLAAPIATSYQSSFLKELGKFFAGLSPLNLAGLSPKDALFQNNSLTGDLLTTIDDKDTRTDIDAFILKYHSKFRDLDLDQAIEKYYSTDGLEQNRQEYYNQTLKEQSGDTTADGYKDFLLVGSIASLSGLALITLKKLKELKSFGERFMNNPIKTIKTDILQPLKNQVTAFFKHPLKFIEKNIATPIGNTLATLGSASLYVGAKAIKTVNNNIVKPVITFVSNNIVKPVNKHVIKPIVNFTMNKVVKPVYQNIIKPVAKPIIKFVHNTVIKPVYNNVIKPAYNQVIKPIAKAIHNNVLKPIYTHVVKPAANFVNRTVIRPAYNKFVKPVYNNFVKPAYNHIVRPIVKPFYQKVVKPIARATNRYIVKPVVNTVNRWIINPIKKWFGGKKGKRK